MASPSLQQTPSQADQNQTGSAKKLRIAALDFTKGALVLTMVLYHWLNYFVGPQDNRYLRFLTPSFIFITGFLISNVYLSKYGMHDPRLPKRLVQRGLKVLAVFLLLNLSRGLLAAKSAEGITAGDWANTLFNVYVLGNGIGGGQAKAVSFFVLVPISYLLILAALLLMLCKFYRYTFHLAWVVCLLGIVLLNRYGLQSANLELLAIGLMGVILGYIPIEKINTYVRHPYFLGMAYLVYLAAISVWNVVYPLQVVGVCLSVMIIYWLGNPSGEPGKIRGVLVLLGKYSLFGYIAQIAILQLLRRGFNHVNSEAVVLGLSFLLSFCLTVASVAVVHHIRSKSVVADRLYRAVFA